VSLMKRYAFSYSSGAVRLVTRGLLIALCLSTAIGARANVGGGESVAPYTLRGDRIAADFQFSKGSLQLVAIEDLESHAKLLPHELFSLVLRDGRVISASHFQLVAAPVEQPIELNPSASRQADRVAGKTFCADLQAQNLSLTVHWCAVLHNDANYMRQEITLKAVAQPVDLAEVRMFDFNASDAHVVGTVAGSPIVAGPFFFGFESPLSVSSIKGGHAVAALTRVLPLKSGQSISYSSVIGVASPGQLRRDFLSYLEQERAHPYRTFLHYNTWYDLGFGERFDEAGALNRIHAFGDELVRKRGVTMDSFLFDDGWDNTHSLWTFNPGFPNGFSNVRKAAAEYGIGIGVWLSPWGGYDKEKAQRIEAGQRAGYETVKGGFALSGPRYYPLFEKTCLEMISKYGVNQFKLDGTGNVNAVFPGSLFDSDFSAAIHLIEQLRQRDPSVFINLTTGTKASPFWLRYADSIWRGGEDNSFDGVGSWRQKWITYRDEQTYQNIVEAGPLFPLSSLMLHGIIYAHEAEHLSDDPGHDFTDEVRSYFGTGTQLQEMYVTPSLLKAKDWDDLAEAARWSRSNAAVLKDTHWIGGDPAKLQVYGWASWTPQKGIVVLRNPSDHSQEFSLDVAKAFELPSRAPQTYKAHSPWQSDSSANPLELHAGQVQRISLKPFEVLTLEALPESR